MQQDFLQEAFLVSVGKDMRSYLTSGIQVIDEVDVTDALGYQFSCYHSKNQ